MPEEPENTISLQVEAVDEGNVIFYTSQGFYRYGPSIMEYEDGSMDMWMSSPGNSGSQWDWISYRHSDDGINWSSEQIVLRPTPGSKDQCSVCDPGVIYFNGYYYLAYTGTDYYEGKGSNNSAFVARSENPYGPFENRLIMYYSEDGKSFTKLDSTKDFIEDYAHNLGVAKSPDGHINTNNEILIGYAYGERWGRWDLKVQNIRISD